MIKQIKCKDLGFEGCQFRTRGATAEAVLQEIVEHLRAEHDVDVPDADVVLEALLEDGELEVDEEVRPIVQHLFSKLDIELRGKRVLGTGGSGKDVALGGEDDD